MHFSDLVKKGQLVKEVTSKAKIAEFLQFAEEELSAAEFNLQRYPLTAYKSAYDALLHAGNALIRYYGYRATAKYTHITITEFVDRVIGKDLGNLARAFKRMRRKRHPLQYDAKFTESSTEVKNSILQSSALVKKIEEHMQIKPPQGKLF